VKELENEIRLVREKYQKIQAEDKKYKGQMSMDIYNVSRSLYDTRRVLKRINLVRRQLENLYKKNLMLRAQVRKLKNDVNKNKDRMDTRCLDVLAQVALKWEEDQVSQSLSKKGEEASTRRVTRSTRSKKAP